jgi:hypothetical protein
MSDPAHESTVPLSDYRVARSDYRVAESTYGGSMSLIWALATTGQTAAAQS